MEPPPSSTMHCFLKNVKVPGKKQSTKPTSVVIRYIRWKVRRCMVVQSPPELHVEVANLCSKLTAHEQWPLMSDQMANNVGSNELNPLFLFRDQRSYSQTCQCKQ